jgi:glycosyltransferase involved in cell wall biosynthesis
MAKRVLAFFPHNPIPARTGAHQRCLQILAALIKGGAEVHFLSSSPHSDSPWTSGSRDHLEKMGVKAVHIYEPNYFESIENRVYRFRRRYTSLGADVLARIHCSLTFRRWFRRTLSRVQPDIVFVNYITYDPLLTREVRQHVKTVIDVHDLTVPNDALNSVATSILQAGDDVEWNALIEDPWSAAPLNYDALRHECQLYAAYHTVIAISSADHRAIVSMAPLSKVSWLPFVPSPQVSRNTYDGPALITPSGNPFNQVGIRLLCSAVESHLQHLRSPIKISLTGVHELPRAQTRVQQVGFVNSLEPLYESAAFLLNPTFLGTGQQIKIAEAMANGLAVLGFETVRSSSLIEHDKTGLLASSVQEFADYADRLWRDHSVRQRLGDQAREAMRSLGRSIDGEYIWNTIVDSGTPSALAVH